MKKLQRCIVSCLLLLLSSGMQAQSYAKLWKQVEEAQQKDYPRTVIELTEKIYRKAWKQKNAGQLLKSYVFRNYYQERLTPDSLYGRFADLEQWAQTEKEPVRRAILHSLLAEEYADYLYLNRYSMRAATDVEFKDYPADIHEWTRNMFEAKIEEHCRASLQDKELLLRVTSNAYIPFIIQEEGGRVFGHDMYHLLADRAIEVYQKMANSRNYGAYSKYIEDIYKEMRETYEGKKGMEEAVLLCTLNETIYQEKWNGNKSLLSKLDSLIEKYSGCKFCAEVYLHKAQQLYDDKKYAFALSTCEEAINRYPHYKRLNAIKNLKTQILQPSLRFSIPESGYPGDSIAINVRFRNLQGFTLQMYSTDLEQVPFQNNKIDSLFYEKHTKLFSSEHIDLNPFIDKQQDENTPYKELDTVVKIQVPKEVGLYVMKILPDVKAESIKSNFFVSTRFMLTTLDLGNGRMEFRPVDARTGEEIRGTTMLFYKKERNGSYTKVTEIFTEREAAVLPIYKDIQYWTACKENDTSMPLQFIQTCGIPSLKDVKLEKRLTLLTDRSIYRPGQTIYVKGIAYKIGKTIEVKQYPVYSKSIEEIKDTAHVIADATFEIFLEDSRQNVLAKKIVHTNDFGSFTTDFTLPTSVLNGYYSICVKETNSSVGVRVEEYKRPTIEVTLDQIKTAYRLNDEVIQTGQINTLNGVNLQGIPVVYRFKLDFAYGVNSKDYDEVVDTVYTDTEGRFAIPLKLTCQMYWDTKNGDELVPVHAYFNLKTTVIDTTGEAIEVNKGIMATPHVYSVRGKIPQYICKEEKLEVFFSMYNNDSQQINHEGGYRLRKLPENIARLHHVKTDTLPVVLSGKFKGNELQDCSSWCKFPSGMYRLELFVNDGKGREEVSEDVEDFMLFSKNDKRLADFTDIFYYVENEEFDESTPASFLLGTSHKGAIMRGEVFSHGKIVSRLKNQLLNDTIVRVELPYMEHFKGEVLVYISFVKEGKGYDVSFTLKKQIPERRLDMKWEVFRDYLQPGTREEWKLVVKDPQGKAAAAEVLALMYDASLDKISPKSQRFHVNFFSYFDPIYRKFSSVEKFSFPLSFPCRVLDVPIWRYDHFYDTSANVKAGMSASKNMMLDFSGTLHENAIVGSASGKLTVVADIGEIEETIPEPAMPYSENAATLPLRTNLSETVFFYPQLQTNEHGEVVISFTVPESLTRWNFQAYAHTKDVVTGNVKATAITKKEFMLQPNTPRYLRIADKTQVTARLTNFTGKLAAGMATLQLFDPMTEKILLTKQQRFSMKAGSVDAVDFSFEVPTGYELLGLRIVADGGAFSDGEQHLLPVLSDKELIVEALPMSVRGEQKKTFSLETLFNGNSRKATNRRLTVEFTSNPAWYAVQALPSLATSDDNNAISCAAAYYANTLAGFIANGQPRIKTVIDSWKLSGGTKDGFLSQLQKNEELKNVLLNESPWLLEANTEAEQRARIATLFDVNDLNNRTSLSLCKLKELQGKDGGWSWYKGMPNSYYVTSFITELLVRLPLLTGKPLSNEAQQIKQKSFAFLHDMMQKEYARLKERKQSGQQVDKTSIPNIIMESLYLMALDGGTILESNREACQYFLDEVLNLDRTKLTMAEKAKVALILNAADYKAEAQEYLVSLREHLIQSEELGTYFEFHEGPYGWGMWPVSAHVTVMEALRIAGTGNDVEKQTAESIATLLEDMKIWLLKKKQTTVWDSPVATADAIYALLCHGENLLKNTGKVRITLGKQTLDTAKDTQRGMAGLGYLKETFGEGNAALQAKRITVQKQDSDMAWGAVYAQYLCPIGEIRGQGGALHIEKQLYVERVDANGKTVLQPVTLDTMGQPADVSVKVGDKVVSRLIIRLDRAMDFLHLKDARAVCFEPLEQLSGYRRNNGFGYYVEVKDAATNFFFDHLGKGVYILEHRYRAVRAGEYETGLARIQCTYAPEYTSHSSGGKLYVVGAGE